MVRHVTYFTIYDKEAKDNNGKGQKINYALNKFSCQGWFNAVTRSPITRFIHQILEVHS